MRQGVLFPIVAILAVMAPDLRVSRSLSVARPEDLVLVWFVLSGGVRSFKDDPLVRSFLYMTMVASFAIIGSMVFWGQPVVVNDFMVLPMLAKYWIAFRLGLSITDSRQALRGLWVISLALAASAAVGIMQYHDTMGINTWLTPHYFVRASTLHWMDDGDFLKYSVTSRAVGLQGDPRHFGCTLVMGVAMVMSLFLVTPARRARGILIVVVVVFLTAMIYTLSRTTLFSLIVVLAVGLLYMRLARYGGGLALVVLIAALGWMSVSQFGTKSFSERVLDTEAESFQTSLHARQRDLKAPFVDAIDDPLIFIIGRGPSKAVLRTSSHNDFAWYLHRFGLLGLGFYVSLLARGSAKAMAILRAPGAQITRAVGLAGLLVMVNWAVFAMAESMFKNVRIMTLNMLVLGLLMSVRQMSYRDRRAAAAELGHFIRGRKLRSARSVPEHSQNPNLA
jgi:hypothetical protein